MQTIRKITRASKKLCSKRHQKRERERVRERERERVVRESGRCVPAGSGVLIRWKEVLLCWWMHEEAADRGSRRAAEFTPHLEKAPSCLIPLSSLSLSLSLSLLPHRAFSPSPVCFVSSGTSSIFSSRSSSSCLPASLTPRGQNGRAAHAAIYQPPLFGPPLSSRR